MFTKRTVFAAVVIVCFEIGFRVEGMHPGERSRATLLIKIDGEWHEFQPTIDVTPLAK